MSRAKGSKNRPAEVIRAEATAVFRFVRSAPKKGRSYTDMLEQVYRHHKGTVAGFNSHLDRGLVTGIMPHLKKMGVYKGCDGRYRATPAFRG